LLSFTASPLFTSLNQGIIMKFKKLLTAGLLVGSMLAAGSASAVGVFNEFTINESVVPGANILGLANPALVVDKLNGSYVERLTQTGLNTFAAQGFLTFTSYLSNDGVNTEASLLNALGSSGGYSIRAVFSATGTITGPNTFASSNTAFTLYLDPNSNTTALLTNGVTAPTLSGTADDIVLATSVMGIGTGNLNGPPGAFNIDFSDFTLSAFGQTFFIDPNPFHLSVRVNGDYDVVSPVAGDPLTRNITGDVSAVFAIPEPSSVGLLGLALIGLAASRRRKAGADQA
jgi:PEP-CTERM motif